MARLLGGPGRGAVLAGAGIPMILMALWLVRAGWPHWPALSPLTLLPYGAAAAFAIGAAADSLGLRRTAVLGVTALFALLFGWGGAGWPLALGGKAVATMAVLAALWLAVLLRLVLLPAADTSRPLLLLVLAIGLAVLTGLWDRDGGFAWALILAGVLAGSLLWVAVLGLPFQTAALLGSGGFALGLGSGLALDGAVPPYAVAVLALVPFTPPLRLGQGRTARLAQPLVLAGTALLPVALAAVIAWIALQAR